MDINGLRELFEENFEELKYEYGRSITLNMKEYAWQQVKLYYERLGNIAKKVKETEVKLILPEQVTPKGKKYTIEGSVNIIKEKDKITMCDIKTNEAKDVQANKEYYKGQLNVYAHIWKKLKNSNIDDMAIIATAPPKELRNALNNNDKEEVEKQLKNWNPLVKVSLEQLDIDNQIRKFGEFVDNIEEGKFNSPSLKYLKTIQKGQRAPFGTAVCRHCDVRHSCNSYNQYINKIELDEEIKKDIAIEDEIEREQWMKSYE
ncbi:PD-(D/E)XK nuclease family protein [Clostridium saccharobutylicum]|uniref:PD-(D/E)XK endonuclease-like domain-containing protein n=1 Tax=Clostridium saccharobutylicum TaxID=169679 RepID=A0A1S8N1V1_CLOSA|nr:PD-(D/E)XK nuclease family protein [Clostridium saccharobutylicum]OOM10434.1 hypothetical protein CLOSAC_30550 [Clostridium saccharobutylicum]